MALNAPLKDGRRALAAMEFFRARTCNTTVDFYLCCGEGFLSRQAAAEQVYII